MEHGGLCPHTFSSCLGVLLSILLLTWHKIMNYIWIQQLQATLASSPFPGWIHINESVFFLPACHPFGTFQPFLISDLMTTLTSKLVCQVG